MDGSKFRKRIDSFVGYTLNAHTLMHFADHACLVIEGTCHT